MFTIASLASEHPRDIVPRGGDERRDEHHGGDRRDERPHPYRSGPGGYTRRSRSRSMPRGDQRSPQHHDGETSREDLMASTAASRVIQERNFRGMNMLEKLNALRSMIAGLRADAIRAFRQLNILQREQQRANSLNQKLEEESHDGDARILDVMSTYRVEVRGAVALIDPLRYELEKFKATIDPQTKAVEDLREDVARLKMEGFLSRQRVASLEGQIAALMAGISAEYTEQPTYGAASYPHSYGAQLSEAQWPGHAFMQQQPTADAAGSSAEHAGASSSAPQPADARNT